MDPVELKTKNHTDMSLVLGAYTTSQSTIEERHHNDFRSHWEDKFEKYQLS